MPKFLFVALLLTAASSPTFAQPQGTGLLSGLVLQKTTNEPVRKAIVILTWHGTPMCSAGTLTDSEGRFTFPLLPAGKYTIRATREPYGSAAYGALTTNGPGEFITLAGNQRLGGLKILLSRPSSISGTVFDPDGDPVSGTLLNLLAEAYPRGVRELVQRGGAMTNDRGEYRITGIEPGTYYLAIGGPFAVFGPRMWNAGDESIPRQFYRAVTDWRRATPIKIGSDQPVSGIEIRLMSARAIPVRGRLIGLPDTDPAGPHAEVSIAPAGDDTSQGGWGTGTSAPQWQFTTEAMPPGRYRITARAEVAKQTYWASQYLDLEHDPGEITLAMAPAATVRGQVRVTGPGAEKVKDLQVTFVRGDSGPFSRDTLSTKIGAEGRFAIDQVPPGIWDINVAPMPKGGFMKSAALGKQDVLTEDMEIGAAIDSPLNIVISTQGGIVEGEFEGDAAKRPIAVLLAPVGRFRSVASFFSTGASGAAGKFRLDSLQPGPYKIFAFEQPPPGDYRNPEFASRIAKLGLDVEVAEASTVKVQPPLITPEQLKEALQ